MLLVQQMAGLEEELSKRTSELQTTRAESSARALLTETRLQQREEELRIANESVTQLREANSTFQRRCDELAQKLEEQRSHELSMHSSYREEIGAQTRLADLYKGMADESNAKAEEFSEAVKELQSLLEQATEQYGTLESEHVQLKLQYEDSIAENSNKIEELSKELERANELLKSIKQERLDQAVEQLAPTAAIASRVLKKGLSLTQIYTQLVDATNELVVEREENERLKSQMDRILQELAEKAPELLQEREEYEMAMENNATLTNQLEELDGENQRLREASEEADRIAKHHTRENQRLKSELADLARQASALCHFRCNENYEKKKKKKFLKFSQPVLRVVFMRRPFLTFQAHVYCNFQVTAYKCRPVSGSDNFVHEISCALWKFFILDRILNDII